jgi:hypothetical protein
MASPIPNPSWRDLKKELMQRWHQLTEHEIDKTRGDRRSLADLLERKVGMAIEEASEKVAEMASHYHLYDEPEEHVNVKELEEEKHERVLELTPKKPVSKDQKPRNPST